MNGRANDRRLPPPLGGGRRPWGRTRRIAAAVVVVVVVASLGRRVGWLARFAPNGVVAAHHVVKGGCSLVALAWVGTGGADVVGSPSDTMGETIPGEERGSGDGGGWRPASPSHVGIVLGGDCGLTAELLVSMVEGEHEVGPSVLDRGPHAPLTDGLGVGAHGLKDAHSGSHNCVPRDVVMAHGKELELGLASPESFNGLGWIPGGAEGCSVGFQLISCDCGIGCNQVLEHVSGMDTGKVQKAITEMPNECVVNVVQDERPNSVHVGNKGAELFHVSGVLTKHDRSEGSTGLWGNHKRLDGWDRVDPSNSVGDGVVLGSGHHSTNMAQDAASSVGWVGAKCCIDGGFEGSGLSCSGSVARGNGSDGVGNCSCHCRKYFGME